MKAASHPWRLVGGLIAAVLALPLAGECLARYALGKTALAATVVDIQTPETLCEKITYARGFSGRKILVMGDSLAFGRAMRDHGDGQWRAHELGSAIGRALPMSNAQTLILNLGLNGGLPADQVQMLRALSGVTFDAIVSTISVRSFATDFALQKAAYSRAWLAGVSCPPAAAPSVAGAVERGFSAVSAFFRSRDLIQRAVFDGTPLEIISNLSKRLRSPEKPDEPSLVPADPQVLLLAKGRFSRISFDEPHAQVAAFKEFRRLSTAAARKVVFVYGKEAGKLLPSLISRAVYEAHRQRLRDLVAPGNSVAYADQLDIPSTRYIDYVHVDAEGYRLIAGQIAPLLDLP